MPQTSKTISTDNLEIAYTKYGDGNDLILFVHGWSCNQTYWKNQIDFFAGNYQVVTIDLGGHGNSGSKNRKDFTIASFGDDVVSVLNQLKFDRLFLVGHSMGALVILDAASKIDNDRIRLFLVDQIKRKYWPFSEERLQIFLKPFREDFKNHTKKWVIMDDNFLEDSNPELIEWISTEISNASPEIAISSIYNTLIRDFDETISELSKRNIPMTLINNKESEEKDKIELMGLRFDIELISGVGHFVMMEKAERFNRILLELIRDE